MLRSSTQFLQDNSSGIFIIMLPISVCFRACVINEKIGKLLFIPSPTAYLFTESNDRLSNSIRSMKAHIKSVLALSVTGLSWMLAVVGRGTTTGFYLLPVDGGNQQVGERESSLERIFPLSLGGWYLCSCR